MTAWAESSRMSAQVHIAICQLKFTLLAQLSLVNSAVRLQLQLVSSVVYKELICDLSALAAMCQLSSNADSQLGWDPFNQPQSVSSTATCQLNCTLSTRVQSVSQSVYNQLLCSLSAPGGVCQLISNAECLLGCSQLSCNFKLLTYAVCQLSCRHGQCIICFNQSGGFPAASAFAYVIPVLNESCLLH